MVVKKREVRKKVYAVNNLTLDPRLDDIWSLTFHHEEEEKEQLFAKIMFSRKPVVHSSVNLFDNMKVRLNKEK